MMTKADFKVMLDELERLYTHYTKEHDMTTDMKWRAYYFGKLDGIAHTRTMLIMTLDKYENEDNNNDK